jgi:hypothetical protein
MLGQRKDRATNLARLDIVKVRHTSRPLVPLKVEKNWIRYSAQPVVNFTSRTLLSRGITLPRTPGNVPLKLYK